MHLKKYFFIIYETEWSIGEKIIIKMLQNGCSNIIMRTILRYNKM